MKKTLCVILSVLLAVCLLTGCGGGKGDDGSEKVLKFGCFCYASTLDPGDETNAAWDVMRMGLSECLFKFDDSMTIQYALCDDCTTEDNITWVLHIRDGLKFSNGTDVTPSLVVASIENVYNNETGTSRPRKYMDYESMTADDAARTVTIVLKAPQVDLRKNLAYPVFAILDTTGDFDWDEHPIGTGPYALVNYEAKVSATLVRNEYYWNGEVPFDKLEIYYLGDAGAKTMALQSGDVDLVENITSAADLKMFKEDKNYNVSIAQGVRCGFAYMNHNGILADPVLRHAILKALDDDTLCNVTLGGLYTPGYSCLPSGLAYGYENLVDVDPYDVAEANRILDEAGYVDTDGDGIREKDGKNIKLLYLTYTNRGLADFADGIMVSLKEIGIDIDLKVIDSDSLWNNMVNGEFDLAGNNWTTVGTGDPTEYLANWYSGYVGTDANGNWNGYKNAEYDELYEKLATTFDEAERAKIIERMQQILIDDAALLVHGYYNSSMESNTSIDNVKIHTADYYWITNEITPAK